MENKQKNIYTLLAEASHELQVSDIKKSGANKYAGFNYFKLEDFLPTLKKILAKKGIAHYFNFEESYAELVLSTNQQDTLKIKTVIPKQYHHAQIKDEMQRIGALQTYTKRLLYLNAFGISEGEIIDELSRNEATYYQQPQQTEAPVAAFDWKDEKPIEKSVNITMPTAQIKAVDNYERAKKIVEFYEEFINLNISPTAKKARINKINKAIEEKTLTTEMVDKFALEAKKSKEI